MTRSPRRALTTLTLALTALALPVAATGAPNPRPTLTIDGNVATWTASGRTATGPDGAPATSGASASLAQEPNGTYTFTFDDSTSIPVFPASCSTTVQTVSCPVSSPPVVRFLGSGGVEDIYLRTRPTTVPVAFDLGGSNDILELEDVVGDIRLGRGNDSLSLRYSSAATNPVVVQGGGGKDTVRLSAIGQRLRVKLDGQLRRLLPGVNAGFAPNIENVVGQGGTGLTAVGDASANRLVAVDQRQAKNRLKGGPGGDRLVGGRGSDVLDARDGKPGDVVTCGRGRDRVLLDQGDRIRDRAACESVRFVSTR